jgi:hypothetical protein
MKKLNSSALGYAISFLLIIALICSGVLFISSANKRLEFHYALKEHLLFDNYVALKIGSKCEEPTTKTIIHLAGDTSRITVKNWGLYRMVVAKTFHSTNQIISSALIGVAIEDELPALYIPENNQVLRLAGDTKLEGIVSVSERGVDRANLAGRSYVNDKLVYGSLKKSERYLPKLRKEYQNLRYEDFISNTHKLEKIHQDSVYSFDTITSLYSSINPIYIQNNIQGNVIIHSFDSIVVSSKAILTNVILIAPKVRFEKKCKISVQVIASKSIVCEEGVRLTYPSTLVLNEQQAEIDGRNHQIILQEHSQVLGGILMVSQNSNFRKPIQLKVSPTALVSGLVYNVGESEMRGSIIGHFYTNALRLNSGGGDNANHLLDCTISSTQLPSYFMLPNWLDGVKVGKQKIIGRYL